MSIECLNYKPINKGSLLGFADFFVPKMGLEIYGCSLFQKDGRRWINFPQKETTDEMGVKKYFSHLRFRDKAHMEAFSKVAIEAIDKFCMEKHANKPQDDEEETIPF
jgi:hypothetical protein